MSIQVTEEQPYSEVVVTLQIRILHDQITRSRISANIHPDPILKRLAEKALNEEQHGTNARGEFVVNFSDAWLDLNRDYPRFDARADRPDHECIEEMNRCIAQSVNWVLDLHRRVMGQARKR